MYADANNLDGWAMLQTSPAFNFRWVTDEKMEALDVMMVPMIAQVNTFYSVILVSIISTISTFMYIS